jgi:hypothetical protein
MPVLTFFTNHRSQCHGDHPVLITEEDKGKAIIILNPNADQHGVHQKAGQHLLLFEATFCCVHLIYSLRQDLRITSSVSRISLRVGGSLPSSRSIRTIQAVRARS